MKVSADVLKRQLHSRHYYSIASKIGRGEGRGKRKPFIMYSPLMATFYSNSRTEMDNGTERCMEFRGRRMLKVTKRGKKNRNQDRIKEDNRTASAQGKKYQMTICHITDSLNAQPALMQAEFSII